MLKSKNIIIFIIFIIILMMNACEKTFYMYSIREISIHDNDFREIPANIRLEVFPNEKIKGDVGNTDIIVKYNDKKYEIPRGYLSAHKIELRTQTEKVKEIIYDNFSDNREPFKEYYNLEVIIKNMKNKIGSPNQIVKNNYAIHHGECYQYPTWSLLYPGLDVSICYLPRYRDYIYEYIEVRSDKYILPHGIHTGMSISDLERILGAPENINGNRYEYGGPWARYLTIEVTEDKISKIIINSKFK